MANATVSLNSTTFNAGVEPGDRLVTVASLSNIAPSVLSQLRLFVDRELMAIEQQTGIGGQLIVRRGVDGTIATRHATNATVYIGRADQFYSTDPVGLPPNELPVYPYINVLTGDVWTAEGDESGAGLQARIWNKVTRSIDAGALGNNQVTVTTPS